MDKRPHVLIFNADQWRGDSLGHVGHPAAVTPTLDRMVETDSVSFRHAFCQNPVCTPSRCSFMSGWYPHVRGHRTMYHMMKPDEPVLLRTLKQHGYFVWWGGKNDLVPPQHGYDDYCDIKYEPPPHKHFPNCDPDWRGPPNGDNYYSFYIGRLAGRASEPRYLDSDWDNVLGAIDLIRNRPADKPLCIYLPLSYPHPPYGVEQPYYSMIDRASVPPRTATPSSWDLLPAMLRGIYERQRLQSWTETRWNELRATYYGMCARVDDQLGMVLDALKQASIYDDTAVFFFSDHGDFTGDFGLVEKTQNTFQDCLTRVPFVVKPPAWINVQPRVSDAMVELVDFPATVEEMTRIGPSHTHFGRSLLPVIAGDRDEHRDAVFCEGGRLLGETQCKELEGGHHTPENIYWPKIDVQVTDDVAHGKAVMCRTKKYKYVRRLYESDELYDLHADPHEIDNRINDPALNGVLAELKDRLLCFYLETVDAVPHQTDPRYT